MEVQIVSMSQDVSFEDGSVTNFISLRTPSGHLIRAVISDDSVPVLADNLAAVHSGAPIPTAPVTKRAPQPSPENFEPEDATIFGDPSSVWMPPGAGAAPVAPSPVPYADPDLSSDDPSVQAAAFKAQQKRQQESLRKGGSQSARQVAKDDMGYPILSGQDGTDPGELVGGGGYLDEDGVGSI